MAGGLKIRDEDKAAVLERLGRGRAKAKRADVLAASAGLERGRTEEHARRVVRALIDDGHPIGSGPEGFWLIATEKDLAQVVAGLEKRARGIEARIGALVRAFRARRRTS